MPAVSLRGSSALITGAAKRIGRQTALTLAREGVNVVVNYRSSRDEAESLASEIRAMGVSAWTLQADFSDESASEDLIDRAFEAAGKLDVLVNNASEFPLDNLDNITFEGLTQSMLVNAWSPFRLLRSFAERAGEGRVVNLLDSRIRGYDWNHVGYILAKQVLAVLTRMCALHYAPGILVNAVSPGLILPPPGQDESYIERLAYTVPLYRHGDPQDIADAVLYLLRSDFLSGEVIYVDGGRHLKEYLSPRKNGD